MTRKQTNNQWSGGIAAHPAQNFLGANIRWKSSGLDYFFGVEGDQHDILLMDYLPKGQTINTEYYLFPVVQLKNIFKEKNNGKFTTGILFLHDNTPAHRALGTQTKLAYLGFQCLDHPHYSPDLTPSDYHLFHGLKKKNIEKSPFFFPCGGHCYRADLVEQTTS